jgi:Lrp/AsnC family transcriptional regulator, leucine-responsive regulatory protein
MKAKIDALDAKILKLLQKDAKLTFKEIAEKINLSLTPTHERIKKLESEGWIEKHVCILNKRKLGITLIVYSQVTLMKQTRELSEVFSSAIKKLPEVIECSFVSGSFDYLLKIVVPDMDAYHGFHQNKLSAIEGVSLINSIFVLTEVKNTTEIPIHQFSQPIQS